MQGVEVVMDYSGEIPTKLKILRINWILSFEKTNVLQKNEVLVGFVISAQTNEKVKNKNRLVFYRLGSPTKQENHKINWFFSLKS